MSFKISMLSARMFSGGYGYKLAEVFVVNNMAQFVVGDICQEAFSESSSS